MSSILDALERASQERSDLLPPQATDAGNLPSRQARRGVWFMLGVALVLVMLIGYGLLPKPNPVPDAEAPVQNAAPVPGEAAFIPDVSQPVSAQAPPTLQSRLHATAQPSHQSLLDKARVTTAATSVRVEEPASATEPEIETRSGIIVEPATAPHMEAPEASSLSRGDMPLPVAEPFPDAAPEPRARPKPEVIRQPNPAHPAPAIPWVWELPQAEREALLELSVSIHVYHQDPKRRFVLINMHRYVEGDRLKEKGYRLVRIDPDGIVLDYGAGLVRIPRS